ncbi:MAG: serine hydrolase [Patescibacteria group bacterium]
MSPQLFLTLVALVFVAPLTNNPFPVNVDITQKYPEIFAPLVIDQRFSNLENKISLIKGTFSVSILDINTGKYYGYNDSEQYYAASLYKLPVAIATLNALDEDLTLDTKLSYNKELHYYGGSGRIQGHKSGSIYTVASLLDYLIKDSDNVAQNILEYRIGSKKVHNLASEFKLSSGFPLKSDVSSKEYLNILVGLDAGRYLSHKDTAYLLNIMAETAFDNRISQGLDPTYSFAHKIGTWPETGSWHDCGLVYSKGKRLAVCVLSRDTTYNNSQLVAKLVGEFITAY